MYPNIGTLLPAMGYGEQQIKTSKLLSIILLPSRYYWYSIDLNRVIKIKANNKNRYDLQEIGHPNLEELLISFLEQHHLKANHPNMLLIYENPPQGGDFFCDINFAIT
jgi:hypothetical protein